LAFKIHSNFNSSDKITKFFANPVNSIDAPLKILFCPTLLQIMSGTAYSVGYVWFYLTVDSYESPRPPALSTVLLMIVKPVVCSIH